jgi:hypothetical protein
LLDARFTLHLDLGVKFAAAGPIIFEAIGGAELFDHISFLRMVESDGRLGRINRRHRNGVGRRHLRQHSGNQQ